MINKPQIKNIIVVNTNTCQKVAVAGAKDFEDEAKNYLTAGGRNYEYVGEEFIDYDNIDILMEILENLGDDWALEPQSKEYKDCGFYFIRKSDNMKLFAQCEPYGSKGRWVFTYVRPRDDHNQVAEDYEGHNYIPSITCTIRKSPEKLADDIQGRLVRCCDQVHSSYLEAIEKANKFYIKEQNVKGIAQTLKGGKSIYFSPEGDKIKISGYINIELAQQIDELINNK